MRIYLYILAGMISALIGWNLGQIFLTDFGLLNPWPEVILFPCIAVSLALGIVLTEMFISNPTRPKLILRIARLPLLIAAGLGLLFGLLAGGISQILFLPYLQIDPRFVRVIGWLLIGLSTGIAEGVTWRWHSLEAGDPKRFKKRFLTSLSASAIASLAAALLFEVLRQMVGKFTPNLQGFEDPIGFAFLGISLGLVFSLSTSPSYLSALRAGAGFEYAGPIYYDSDDDLAPTVSVPSINLSHPIKFVSASGLEEIEEGLSIQLPETGKINIGSENNPKAWIRLPGVPIHVADLNLTVREAQLLPNPKFCNYIEVNGRRLHDHTTIKLKHNHVIAFYLKNSEEENGKSFYRFIYYNRFLDPQA